MKIIDARKQSPDYGQFQRGDILEVKFSKYALPDYELITYSPYAPMGSYGLVYLGSEGQGVTGDMEACPIANTDPLRTCDEPQQYRLFFTSIPDLLESMNFYSVKKVNTGLILKNKGDDWKTIEKKLGTK